MVSLHLFRSGQSLRQFSWYSTAPKEICEELQKLNFPFLLL